MKLLRIGRELSRSFLREDLAKYVWAVGFSLIALIIANILDQYVHQRIPLVFLMAVVLSAYYGGLGPGLLAAVLSTFLAGYFFIEPVGSILANVDDLFLLVMFLGLSVFISWLEEAHSRSKQALQDAKQELETILGGVGDGITVRDARGHIVFANDLAARLLGFASVAEMAHSSFDDWSHNVEMRATDGTPLPLSLFPGRSVLVEGVASELSFQLQFLRTGEQRWLVVKSTPLFDASGDLRLAIKIVRDVTAQRRSEEVRMGLLLTIDQQRRRIQAILDNVPGIVWESQGQSSSVDQKTIFVSAYAPVMLGYDVGQWLNNKDFWRRIIHPDDWQAVVDQTEALFQGTKTGNLEFRLIAQDGRVVPVEAHMSVLTDREGNPIGSCGMLTDITERYEAEAQLARNALDLERSNQQLQQFAYVASHDLQEPLRMVASYLQLLESRYKDALDDDAREFIAYAVDGATRMRGMINDLLAYSRLDAQEKNFELIESRAAVDQACDRLRSSIDETGATITYDDLPAVRAEEVLLVQLFQNLIGNAIKYRSDAPPVIHVGAEARNGEWLFSVSDNGIGIEPQYLERIFVIFRRLHAPGKYTGTGIGLAICKKVVERHGGRIWAESQIGKGSVFYFTIPM